MSTDNFQSGKPADRAAGRERPLRIPGGMFIVFEGIDGTGKSTQVRLLADKLRQLGYVVVATREPTEGPYGQKIRKLFVNRQTVTKNEELELFIADRNLHVNEVISPALAEGCVVISDRYYLSTVAYQGANGMDQDLILQKNEDFPVPDLAIILEIDPVQGIHRIQNQRNEHPNSFEDEANLQKVAKIFGAMEQNFIKRINGSGTIEEVHNKIFEEVKSLLARKNIESMV